ncbi:MAG: hypothetical protein SAL07_06330 [Oscillatoria sp. PMC 1051.18]|uniref:hypothetical protein n=1 Tax=Oscillatoria salina TaxID=331517 RepID=UPI001CCF297E|nr:hypothetical protein [Oscillatoria salina]MBZ8180249.1 hypothetical protein [Oscillatoria salina IIICB1]MEC4892998.1 hypothetical protein [Oscillatoria sp. PMC 1050.18]MEC5029511.1 hypothetical protein [Oscillatoria sp. PMC 1051.18]
MLTERTAAAIAFHRYFFRRKMKINSIAKIIATLLVQADTADEALSFHTYSLLQR